MKCVKCCIEQNYNCFYFIDGGLLYTDELFDICKQCILIFNESRKINKYYNGQIKAQFYGAKSVINGERLSIVLDKIDNGIKKNSNRMGIQNFLYLFGKKGLSSVSKQIKNIFNELNI